MNYLPVDLEKAAATIKNGGLLLYPTDTIWGLGCDATNVEAVGKIFQLKMRSPSKSMIILMGKDEDLSRYISDSSPELTNLLREAMTPTTVIFSKGKNISKKLLAADGSIAIRIPRDEFCQQLLAKAGVPVVSTSANLSGEIAGGSFSGIPADLRNGVDYIVKYRQEEKNTAPASKIARLSHDGQLEYLR